MKQTLKDKLRYAFEAPAPLRKEEFLRSLSQPRMNLCEFIVSQVGYIRKWIWGVSALVFALSLLAAKVFPKDMVLVISALTPLLALTVVSECGRSESYEMAELEMATRFSLRSIVIARLGILGAENLVLLCLLIPLGIWKDLLNPIMLGIFILTPYLLTAFIGLNIVRKFRGREAIFFCAATAALVSITVSLFGHMFPQSYQGGYLVWWIAVAMLLCVGIVRQTCQLINKTEEFV